MVKRISEIEREDIEKFMFNRYLKLVIPLLLCEVCYFICYKLGIGGQLFTEEDSVNSIFVVLSNALFRVPCYGDTTFAGAFWMMKYIFVGGCL